MKINRDLFMAAAMALAIPSSPLVGCATTGSSSAGASAGEEGATGPAEERDCSVEDCSDLRGPADERDCSVEDCSDLMGPADERDCSVEDCSDLRGPADERDCGVEDCSDLMK